MIKQISPSEVKKLLDSGAKVRLIDVREKWEFETARIENTELMPLSEFNVHYEKLNPDDKLIICCHSGNRSFRVCAHLIKNGFKDVSNLDGGITAWSQEVDSSIPIY